MKRDVTVFFCAPKWDLSGVNTLTARLVLGLRRQNIDARILITAHEKTGASDLLPPKEIPFEVLPIKRLTRLTARWRPLIDHLSSNSPCVFVPNYDFSAAVVSTILPSNVGIIGALHSDESDYYHHAERFGSYWNRIVTVSSALKGKVDEKFPHFADRVFAIPNGIETPPEFTKSPPRPGHALHLVYTGRIVQKQKRIFDLVAIAERLRAFDFPFLMTIAGSGSHLEPLRATLKEKCLLGNVRLPGRLDNTELEKLYREAHVFLLVSDYEGLPMSLLEAMSWGCVPVCTRTPTGASEVIENGQNGYLKEIGDHDGIAEIILGLSDRSRWKILSDAARKRVASDFSEAQMHNAWTEIIHLVSSEITSGTYKREPGVMRHLPGEDPFSVALGRTRINAGRIKQNIRARIQSFGSAFWKLKAKNEFKS